MHGQTNPHADSHSTQGGAPPGLGQRMLWDILCSSNRVTVSVYIVRVFLVHRTSSLLHPHLTVQQRRDGSRPSSLDTEFSRSWQDTFRRPYDSQLCTNARSRGHLKRVEDDGKGFQRSVNQIGGALLGVLPSTPVAFLEAGGGSMLAVARLNRRQGGLAVGVCSSSHQCYR